MIQVVQHPCSLTQGEGLEQIEPDVQRRTPLIEGRNKAKMVTVRTHLTVSGSQAYQARQRRHCTNLLGTIRADLKQAGLGPLRTARQLHCLR